MTPQSLAELVALVQAHSDSAGFAAAAGSGAPTPSRVRPGGWHVSDPRWELEIRRWGPRDTGLVDVVLPRWPSFAALDRRWGPFEEMATIGSTADWVGASTAPDHAGVSVFVLVRRAVGDAVDGLTLRRDPSATPD